MLLSATINGGTVFQPQVAPRAGLRAARALAAARETTVTTGLAEGFLGAVNEGSASTAFDPDIMVAGKTGTCAGVGWLASYAPADDPRDRDRDVREAGLGPPRVDGGRADLPVPVQARAPPVC